MGPAGRQYLVSNFTPELIAKQYKEVLCEAVRVEVGASYATSLGQVRQKI